jgi:16S rRNA (cytosine967-C5)-methyltransferase
MTAHKHRRRDRVGTGPLRTAGTSRRLAYDVLSAWQQRGAFAGRVLEELARKYAVSGSDRALAMELSYGVIRRQATLDAVLTAYVDRPRTSVESRLWTLLQLGAYQVLLMPQLPAHAAVHETVDLAKQLHRPAWAPMLNAVLRALSAGARPIDDATPAADRIPIDAQHAIQLDRPVFPPPESAAVEYLAKTHSYPRWIVREWTQRYGVDEAARLCVWFNLPQPVTLRVNRLQQTPEVVMDVLEAAGVSAGPGRWPESLRLGQSVRVEDLPGLAEGWFSVQDESSMAAARLLDPQPGENVLDLCAAPGGKSTHLAELMQDRGTILAIDQDAARLQRVTENARRLRLNSIECRLCDGPSHELPEGPFDRVLVDVPCSNTGVLGKRPEARWRLDPHDFEELTALQERLLLSAIERVTTGGYVVYSTCSIDPRENRQVIDRVLARRSDVRLEQELEHQPGRPSDGGYLARLRRQD